MNPYVIFTFGSLGILILLAIVYFIKPRIKNEDNKIYSRLIICSIIGCLVELSMLVTARMMDKLPIINSISSKGFLIVTELWITLLTLYTIYSTTKESDEVVREKRRKYGIIATIAVFCVGSIATIILPIRYFYGKDPVLYLYTYGPSTKGVFAVGMTLIILNLFYIFISPKKGKSSKFIPIYLYIILSTLVSFIQQVEPTLTLISYVETIIIVLMYFTIENPDVKMIAQLEVAKDAAEKANSAKTDFLANMSHEIRTPLNAIVGFSEFVADADSLEEAKENAKDIVSASGTLLEIVNGILDISKIEAGKIEILNAPYKPKEVFEELAKLITPRMQDKCLDFTYTIDEKLPKVLIGDAANLRKIVTNFLSNACKYTPDGYVKYNVGCELFGDTARLTISVEDSGQGVKKENLDKLFTKFQRLESDKNANIEGTGLGLNITKQLAEMMGGKIGVESEFGKGSTFSIVINQKIGDESLLDDTSKIDLNLDLSDVKILMVDDNELNIKVGLKVFKNYNANCIDTAKDGYECLEKVKKNNNYDIILLDDQMPGMNGGQTLEELKKIEGFNIPVIALTANALTGMREKYIEQGFNDYLAKPLEKIQIVKVLNKIIKDFNIKNGNMKEEVNKMNEEFNQNLQGTPVAPTMTQQQVSPVQPQVVQQVTQTVAQVPPTNTVVPQTAATVQPQTISVAPQQAAVSSVENVVPVAQTPIQPEQVSQVVAQAPVVPTPQPMPAPVNPVAPTPQPMPAPASPVVPTQVVAAPVEAVPVVQSAPVVEAASAEPVAAEPAPVMPTEAPVGDPKQFLISNGCDIDKALELLGDMEMYNETVCDFLEEVDEKWQRIQDYQLAGDMPNYAIEVHSLKSDARYLGFYVLGDIAFNHEMASKENNVQYVNEHYPELVAEYNKTLDIIKRYKNMI